MTLSPNNSLDLSGVPQGNILKAVKSSCKHLAETATADISIQDESIDQFLSTFDVNLFKDLTNTEPFRVPLRFDSIEAEINFIALLDLLNFGSGWRVELHNAVGRGASEAIKFGAMAMHISGITATTEYLKSVTISEISSLFDIPVTHEVPHPSLPVVIGEPAPIRPFVQAITDTLKETGECLESQGFKSLGHFILQVTQPSNDSPRKAADVVEAIVRLLPSMRDYGEWHGQRVYILKRAQLLVCDLYRRFGGSDPKRFAFQELDQLTIFSDNVVPRVLEHFGIIKIHNPSLVQMIQAGRDLGKDSDRWDWALRAIAIEATERILDKAHSWQDDSDPARSETLRALAAFRLDNFLWGMGKQKDIRSLTRLVNKQTVYF
ncbi:uncharacterized protein BJ171DRAFT_498443 [Polychytrium aggregatum]|uniref:uncharacterized protein n=1 Tax=Polychytrium aggregatum TaxID=110093 RepID=UPI0022FDEA59|nr:uncharacterized protein BJ171DRAFT_498443 [Polychytrium aggregatum]KAI9206030.1 hypothetical protein BJ171DRAFT_498443 [Polychytrium aggregatum]